MSHQFNPEVFARLHKAQIDGLLTFANTAFAGMERLAALNLNTARGLLEESAGSAQALLGSKDLQGFATLQQSLTQPVVDKMLQWSRSTYEISHATRTELSKSLDSQLAEVNQALDSTLDVLAKNAPAGTDAIVSPSITALKSAIGVANTAYATLSQNAKQACDYTESQFSSSPKPAAKAKKA